MEIYTYHIICRFSSFCNLSLYLQTWVAVKQNKRYQWIICFISLGANINKSKNVYINCFCIINRVESELLWAELKKIAVLANFHNFSNSISSMRNPINWLLITSLYWSLWRKWVQVKNLKPRTRSIVLIGIWNTSSPGNNPWSRSQQINIKNGIFRFSKIWCQRRPRMLKNPWVTSRKCS